jgi:AcrR family transcriptional regulator
MPEVEVRPRRRNRRGEGAQLRDDIVQAASTLLEQTGREDAVTLRAVARAAGITAPSIYAHFRDPYEIKLAVVQRTFSMLAEALRPASAEPAQAEPGQAEPGQAEPGRAEPGQAVPALYAVCRAYLDFAAEHPDLYRVLFERQRREAVEPGATGADVTAVIGADVFGVLLDAVRACVDAGYSAETSPQAAALRVWVCLHGMATLRASLPWFPWPPRDTLLDDLVRRTADLRTPPRDR